MKKSNFTLFNINAFTVFDRWTFSLLFSDAIGYKFFLSFETIGSNTNLPIQLEAKVNEYLSLVMRLIFAFGISFQLPVFLNLLARIGVVNSDYLKKEEDML